MISSKFVVLGLVFSVFGSASYLRDTYRGAVLPNRFTWGLWGVEALLSFVVEMHDHVGAAAFSTLTFGVFPILIVAATFRSRHYNLKIKKIDILCAIIALVGVAAWAISNQPIVGLLFFVGANEVSALPTVHKSWVLPQTESPLAFSMSILNAVIALLVLKHFTTAGALFPISIAITDAVIVLIVLLRGRGSASLSSLTSHA